MLECQECVKNCPAFAIRMDQRDQHTEVAVGAVVVSTGHKLFAADLKPEYGFGPVPECDHRHADGSPARAHASVQHGAAAR